MCENTTLLKYLKKELTQWRLFHFAIREPTASYQLNGPEQRRRRWHRPGQRPVRSVALGALWSQVLKSNSEIHFHLCRIWQRTSHNAWSLNVKAVISVLNRLHELCLQRLTARVSRQVQLVCARVNNGKVVVVRTLEQSDDDRILEATAW